MQKTKRIIALILVCVLALSLSACGENADVSELEYTWNKTELIDKTAIQENLKYLGFEKEELKYAPETGFGLVKAAAFSQNGTYSLYYDREATEKLLKDYFTAYIELLYENSEKMKTFYGERLDSCKNISDFEMIYAEFYSCDDFNGFLDLHVGTMMDYYGMDDNIIESGTFSAEPGMLKLRPDGSKTEDKVGFEIENNELTLIYSNASEVYSRK